MHKNKNKMSDDNRRRNQGRRGRGGSRYGQKRPEITKPEVAVDENSAVILIFRQYQSALDCKHDKHERIVKLSRDITIESKRTISELQRYVGSEHPEEVVSRAREKLAWIRSHRWTLVARELNGEDPYQFLRAYSPGLQEYIEAVSFLHYITKQDLVTLSQVEKQLVFLVDLKKFDEPHPRTDSKPESSNHAQNPKNNDSETSTNDNQMDTVTDTKNSPSDESKEGTSAETTNTETGESSKTPDLSALTEIHVHVPPIEYILGIADLTGEMMRMAIISVSKGDFDGPFRAAEFMRLLHDAMASFGPVNRDLNHKMRVLRQSLQKVELACYNLQVRSSEIPREMLLDLLTDTGTADRDDDSTSYT